MKDYLAACRFPTCRIGDVAIPRLILGHLPFVGESYQGQSRNLEYVVRFSNMGNTVKIIKIAVEKFGITVVSAGAMGDGSELEHLLLRAITEAGRETGIKIGIIPCVQIPLAVLGRPVDTYRRWLTYYWIELGACKDLARRYLEDPILQCRAGWKEKFEEALKNLKPYGAEEIKSLQVDFEKLDIALQALKGLEVLFVELGSECDFLAMAGRTDILGEVVDHVLEEFDGVLLGTHHAGSAIPILERSEIEFEGYVTPVNRLGVMMFPTAEEALNSIRKSKKPVIAIKPLAGGRIEPRSAFRYVYEEAGMSFSMVGVGSEKEAEENFSTVAEIVGRHPAQTIP